MKIVELKNDKQNYHIEVNVPNKDIVSAIDAKLADIKRPQKWMVLDPVKCHLAS